ncbi:hypothetical protein ACHAW5_003503 [Stephanodiscus triporus]|uniref:HSF-type DNA-binding domain-containing protein n=1 Tax=Stephanodiscus triporus TaxID=2934178 RepID=A0ABD3QEI2_9STRA
MVSWLPEGRSFAIKDPAGFLELLLPMFFKSSKDTKLRSFYRKLNRWGFFILRGGEGGQQEKRRRSSQLGANDNLAISTEDTGAKNDAGEILLPNPNLATVPAHADANVNDLSDDGILSTARKGVWHHPDFYRSRAVEYLTHAMKTGDYGVFLTVIRPGTNSNNHGGDGRDVILRFRSSTEEEEIELGMKKKRNKKRRMTMKSASTAGSSHGDDLSMLASSSDAATAAVMMSKYGIGQKYPHRNVPVVNDPATPVDTATGNVVTMNSAMVSFAAHQQQYQHLHQASATATAMSFYGGDANVFEHSSSDRSPMLISSACGGGSSAIQNDNTTNNKRGRHSMSYSYSHNGHTNLPFHYLPVAHLGSGGGSSAIQNDNTTNNRHSMSYSYSHTAHPNLPFHYLPVAHLGRHSDGNPQLQHAGRQQHQHQQYPHHSSWTAGVGMGGIGAMALPQSVGRSQSIPQDSYYINNDREHNSNAHTMEQNRSMGRELKMHHQAQQFGKGGIGAMAVWQSQSLPDSNDNINFHSDNNSNAPVMEIRHCIAPHHHVQQFGMGPPFPDDNTYINNHCDSKHVRQNMGQELNTEHHQGLSQSQTQVIQQNGVKQEKLLASEDFELANFFEAFAESLRE